MVDCRIADARANGIISIISRTGQPLAIWRLENAWPSRLTVTSEAFTMLEEVETVFDAIIRSN